MAKKGRRKPPSRVRYEESHPVVSCRLPLGVYKRLQEAQEDGKSYADIFKLGLGIHEKRVKKEVEVWDKAFARGFEEAEGLYGVSFGCAICGQPIRVSGQEAKAAAGKYMTEHGWGHRECHEKRQRGA